MRTHRLIPIALFFVFAAGFIAETRAGGNLSELTRDAVSENAEVRASSVAALRARGQAGLDALFETYAGEIRRQLQPSSGADTKSPEWLRVAEALDAVAQQRDSFASRLYWHTDIEEAKRASRAAGKPILSLRLLGNLNEEYSCANSRFFRTVLYSNSEVSAYLREHFVLHWKTVRPAPRVIIDFGDGRRLERTITGNSIHYVLDSEGWPVDALPGLYGPRAFLRELTRAEEGARAASRLGQTARTLFLSEYYNSQALTLIKEFQSDAERAKVALPEGIVSNRPPAPRSNVPPSGVPTALQAAPVAVTKMSVEIPTVRATYYNFNPAAFSRIADIDTWNKLAALRRDDARLDASSTNLLIRHNPYTGADAPTPGRLRRIVRNFELRMALDTVRNQYLMRPALLRWLAEGAGQLDADKLNQRVYTELFLTPDSDPWLGLLTPDTYTGLENDGVVLPR